MVKEPLYTLEGQAVPGKRLGTCLGFPTANLAYHSGAEALPRDGVYVATAGLDGENRRYVAILNQGRHPTAPEGRPTIEAHLLDYDGGDLYGRRLTLWYEAYLRPEETFSGLPALKAQLEKDREAARRWAQASGVDLRTRER